MRTNLTTPVGSGDDPGPGTGNARGIREDTGEEPEVGRVIVRGIGIREIGVGARTGHIGVEAIGRLARAGTEEAAVP
jgi:hypothetical protein